MGDAIFSVVRTLACGLERKIDEQWVKHVHVTWVNWDTFLRKVRSRLH